MGNCKICKNCRYMIKTWSSKDRECKKAPIIKVDPITGVHKKFVLCKDRNKNLKCPWFELPKPELNKIRKYREFLPGTSVLTRVYTGRGNYQEVSTRIIAHRDKYYFVILGEFMVWIPEEDIIGKWQPWEDMMK